MSRIELVTVTVTNPHAQALTHHDQVHVNGIDGGHAREAAKNDYSKSSLYKCNPQNHH